LIPKPIPGIPYNRISASMPWGELVALGIYNLRTGEVFSWLSLQCRKRQSPIIQLFIPSFSYHRPTVVVADLREIEDIVTKRLDEIDRSPLMHDFFGLLVPRATIGMPTGSVFKQQRRLWNSMLSPKFLREVAAPKFHETFIQLSVLWREKAKVAQFDAFEINEDIKLATLDAIWQMAVGSDLGLLVNNRLSIRSDVVSRSNGKIKFAPVTRPPFYRSLCTLLTCLDWVMQGVSPRMYTWIFRHTSMLPSAERVKNDVLDEIIHKARENVIREEKSSTPCALDHVLRQDATCTSRSGAASSNEALRDELLELLITGHETTASSISWAIKYLTDHQSIQKSLRASLYAAFPGTSPANLPSANDLASTALHYLDAVIEEVLRLSRTGPVSFRQAIKDCNILGHQVPAGTPIILVTAGPSYDDPNRPTVPEALRSPTSRATRLRRKDSRTITELHPDQFIPERWLTPDRQFNHSAVHSLPFSSGPRGCFGKKIALLEMRLMISLLVIQFEFPKLPAHLSRYTAKDGLTRRPVCSYVR
ncbi:cytochrome P450, partial [Clohesyomyces aquaticus]